MRRVWAIAALVTALATGAGGEEGDPLTFNPFAVPDLGSGAGAPDAPASQANDAWVPVLRATLVANDGSFVDLGGVLLAVGESHRGWQLVEVREFEAVFERHGEQVELAVPAVGSEGSE